MVKLYQYWKKVTRRFEGWAQRSWPGSALLGIVGGMLAGGASGVPTGVAGCGSFNEPTGMSSVGTSV